MLKHIGIYLISIVVVGGLLANTILDPVERDEVHVLRTFGKTTAVWDGQTDSGLNVKWPWPIQSVTSYDRTLQRLESPTLPVTTADNMAVMISISIAWRIDKAEKFIRSPETMPAAQEALRSRLQDKIRRVAKRYTLAQLVNVDPDQVKINEMTSSIHDELDKQVQEEFGIAVPIVRISRLGPTKQTSKTVIDTIVEERKAAASRYRAEGEARALAIRERAKTAKEMILAFARRKAGEISAKGEEATAKYYSEFNEAIEFAKFLRELEGRQKMFEKNDTLLILSPDMLPSLRYIKRPPTAEELKADYQGANSNAEEN